MRRAVFAVMVAGCSSGASSDPGLGSLLQIDGAQYRPGAFPADEGGPMALSLQTTHTSITIDQVDEKLDATLDVGARGVVIGVVGADDAWLVTAGPPDIETPEFPSGKATFGLAQAFPPGPFTLQVAASDEHGRFGTPATVDLVAEPEDPPTGELVIGLAWSTSADLDLHVVDALGGEAWSDKPNTFIPPPPGTPIDPAELAKHGILDHDGNMDCRRDGHPNEHVIWTVPPPAGDYIIRVDARAMCGDPSTTWFVAAYRNGMLIDSARGVSTAADVSLYQHGAGAGVLALRFSL